MRRSAAAGRVNSGRGPSTRGLVLISVLLVFFVIELVTIGIFGLVASDLHGMASSGLSLQSFNAAEAGVSYAVAQLIARGVTDPPTDSLYAGELAEITLPTSSGDSVPAAFRVTVGCVSPPDARPPDCPSAPYPSRIDARHLRRITSVGLVPATQARARRELDVVVRRYAPQDADDAGYGVCGRQRVELDHEAISANVGSNGDIIIGAAAALRASIPQGPATAPRVEQAAIAPVGPGLTGRYSWRVTFLEAAGQESSGSPATAPVVLTRAYAHLTDIPLGGSSTVARRIYRTRSNAATGPWYFVGDLRDNVTRDYTDSEADAVLFLPLPSPIRGDAAAEGTVRCEDSCQTQLDGAARSQVRERPCPNFLLPPCHPGIDPAPSTIVQEAFEQEMRWGALRVRPGEIVRIITPPNPQARLHLHLASLEVAREGVLAVSGEGTVYMHVSGPVLLEARAVLGAAGDSLDLRLIMPADRVQLLSCAEDSPGDLGGPEVASVRWIQENRVSALVFAPHANVLIENAETVGGSIFANAVRIRRSSSHRGSVLARYAVLSRFANPRYSSGLTARFMRLNHPTPIMLDPAEAIGAERSGVRPSPFQYVISWHDNPYLGP